MTHAFFSDPAEKILTEFSRPERAAVESIRRALEEDLCRAAACRTLTRAANPGSLSCYPSRPADAASASSTATARTWTPSSSSG